MNPALSFRLAYRHVLAGLGRMALSVIALALGVALVVAIRLMNAAVLDSFLDTVDGMAGRAALTVTAGEGLTFDERLVDEVAKVPGVTLAVPLVVGVAFPDDGSGELLTVHGVDIGNDAAVRVYHRGDTTNLVDDTVEFLNSKDSIVLGRAFAERRGISLGSSLPLVTPTGVKTFKVRGLLDPEGLAKTLDGRLVVMDVYAAQFAFTARGQINQIDLLVSKGQEDAVRRGVESVLPAGLKVEVPALRKDVVRRTVAGFQAMLTAFALLAVLAGFVICYSRLAAVLEARTWEAGLLRAVGLRRSVVFRELLKESILIGAVGTGVGLVAGSAIGRLALPAVATATAINFRLPVAAANPAAERGAFIPGVLVGLGAAILAAIVPALRLANKQPIAALTMRGSEGRLQPMAARNVLIAVGGFVAAGALVALQTRFRIPALGNLTTVVVAVAACAMAWPLVRSSKSVLGYLWPRLFGPSGAVAAWHLQEDARRAAFMVATIGIGIGVVYMFGILAWSFEQTLVTRISTRTRADLTITSAYLSGGYQSAPLAESVMREVAATPGIAAVTGQQRRDILYGERTLTIDGFDPLCFTDRRVCEWILEANALPDALEFVAGGRGVLLTSPLAAQLELHPGDEIVLASPRGPQEFRIAAITRSDVAGVLVMSRDRYREAWNDDAITWLYAAVSDGVDPKAVEDRLARDLGSAHRLVIRTRAGFVQHLADQARQAFGLLYIMEAVVFVLVLIGLGDTLATSVFERTREVGMMRAVGIRREGVVRMVVLEAAAIALLGILVAGVSGFLLGAFWVRVQFPLVVGWALDYHFPGAFVLGATVLTVLLCLVGAFVPSWRAARLPVPAALRAE